MLEILRYHGMMPKSFESTGQGPESKKAVEKVADGETKQSNKPLVRRSRKGCCGLRRN